MQTPTLPGTKGGFTVKQIMPKLQGLSIARATFQGPGTGPINALKMPWNLTAHIWKKLATGLPSLTTSLKLYVTLSKTSCEAKISS